MRLFSKPRYEELRGGAWELRPAKPVIVTASWANPFVETHCLVNGAFAYVRKPFSGSDPYSRISDEPRPGSDQVSWPEFDRLAKTGADHELVLIQRYLTSVAAEVLKALAYLQIADSNYDV
jgi:hypothetical protein